LRYIAIAKVAYKNKIFNPVYIVVAILSLASPHAELNWRFSIIAATKANEKSIDSTNLEELPNYGCISRGLLTLSLNWRSPIIPTTKAFEKSLYSGNLEELPNHRRIPHTLRSNGKELSKQIDESVKLTNHAKDRPPKHDQSYSTKE
jgi:hypothetical protein